MGCCPSCCGFPAPRAARLSVPSEMEQLLGHQTVVSVSQSLEANKEALSLMSRSFGGTATTAPEGTFDWVLGKELHEQWEDPRRIAMVDWLMKFDWSSCMARGGFVLGMRKTDGTLGAVVMVLPYEKGHLSNFANLMEILRALWGVGPAPKKLMGKLYQGQKARLLAATEKLEEVKRRHIKGPHAHVRNMSVDPDAQGLGFCGKLMRAVNAWADKLQLPLWLETSGERNVAIYQRFGYKTMEQYSLESQNDPEIHENEFGMMREPGIVSE